MGNQIECPVCHEGELEINYDLAMEIADACVEFKYVTLACPCCNTFFHHTDFQGNINFISNWADLYIGPDEPDEVENWADNEASEWECSDCHLKRKKAPGDPAFKFCPDCGKPVWRY